MRATGRPAESGKRRENRMFSRGGHPEAAAGLGGETASIGNKTLMI